MTTSRKGVVYSLITAIPLVIALLQMTAGEASVPVYITTAIPALFWALIPIAFIVFAILKKHRLWAAVNVVILLFVVFIQAGYCFGTPGEKSGGALRLMTLNVEKFNDHSPETVAEHIRAQNADVICLQELPTTSSATEFAALFDGYECFNLGRLGILTRLPMTKVSHLQLRVEARRALSVEVAVGKIKVTVLNVHLQHFPSDKPENIGSASRNLLVEVGALDGIVRSIVGPLIVAGDLNSIPSGRVNRMLRSHLSDCFWETSRGYGFTLPASFPMRRIDYIYAGNGLEPISSKVADAVVSDHRAVVSDVVLR